MRARAVLFIVALCMVLPAFVDAKPLMSVDPERTPLSCDGKPADFHAQRAQHIIEKAHGFSRILDPSPAKGHEKRAWRSHVLCLLDKDRRARLRNQVERVKARFNARFTELITPPGRAWLDQLGGCEADSSGGYYADTGNGYAGRYQFSQSTWDSTASAFRSLTGIEPNGSRLAAPREQDIRAAWLRRTGGPGHWPVCAPW